MFYTHITFYTPKYILYTYKIVKIYAKFRRDLNFKNIIGSR